MLTGEQIQDSGAVIGYKPNLRYVKDNKNTFNDTNSNTNINKSNYDNSVTYTETVSSFIESLPSKTISVINNSFAIINGLIDKLSDEFNKLDISNFGTFGNIETFISALNNDNIEYAEQFLEYHQQNISSSVIPDILSIILDSKKRLQTLSEELKYLYYGNKDFDDENMKQYEKSLLNYITQYEENDEKYKINYFSLASDSMVNKSVCNFVYGINEKLSNLSNVILLKDDTEIDLNDLPFVKDAFDKSNASINQIKYTCNLQQSIEIMNKTLYNYYINRKNTCKIYNMYSNNIESITIGNMLIKSQDATLNSIKNINKMSNGYLNYLFNIGNLEKEKHLLMNVYQNSSYK